MIMIILIYDVISWKLLFCSMTPVESGWANRFQNTVAFWKIRHFQCFQYINILSNTIKLHKFWNIQKYLLKIWVYKVLEIIFCSIQPVLRRWVTLSKQNKKLNLFEGKKSNVKHCGTLGIRTYSSSTVMQINSENGERHYDCISDQTVGQNVATKVDCLT